MKHSFQNMICVPLIMHYEEGEVIAIKHKGSYITHKMWSENMGDLKKIDRLYVWVISVYL